VSCPGLTRASIILRKSLSKGLDCRVKPGNDESQLVAAGLNKPRIVRLSLVGIVRKVPHNL
jgi:hypothetical protein